jgi:hypothetical protein
VSRIKTDATFLTACVSQNLRAMIKPDKRIIRLLPLMVLAVCLRQSAVAQTNRVAVPDPQDWVMKGRGNFAD